jgi:flagellar hook-associated protein 3 FlgL
MRISTASIFDSNSKQLNKLQASIARTQDQLSSNTRILAPSDDPVASARALEVTQSQEMNEQYETNRTNARSSLSQVEVALGNTTTLIQQIQTLAVSAGNGGMTQADRNSIASELEGRLADLLGVANTTDGAGGFLFSGYKATTQPFNQTSTGATYGGDQGQRMLQVGPSRQLAISDSGSSIFENNATGNGTFQTQAAGANTGSGVISPGAVVNPTQVRNHDYSVKFTVVGTPPVTTYEVEDKSSSTIVVPATAYKSGDSITFDGISFDVKGAPNHNDSFSVTPSHKQSVFQTVTELIATIRTGTAGPGGSAAMTNGLNTAHSNLAAALENVLTVRSSVGARLKELDYLDSNGDDLKVQYAETLEGLTGLDPAKAISDFTQQQFTLEAAQKSFKAMSGLSLFNYI